MRLFCTLIKTALGIVILLSVFWRAGDRLMASAEPNGSNLSTHSANFTQSTLSVEFSTPTPTELPNTTSTPTETPGVTNTPEPTGQPTSVSTPTSEAVPTTVGTETPAVPSNPSNESLIGPDGKLKPYIPLKFLGLAEHAPNWGKMPLNSDGTVIMGVVTPFEPVFGIVNGAFSAVVEKPVFEENGHTYIGIISQDSNGRVAHMKLRIDEFTGKNKKGYYLTGYADAIGGVWTPNPALSPVSIRTDSFRAVELLQIKDDFVVGDQIVINFADVRAADVVPNLTDTQIEQMIQSGKEFGEQNNRLINGQIGFDDGMEIGTVLGVIDPSPHPTPPPTETPVAPGNQPFPQVGETDYSKMSQEELKKIADQAERLLGSKGEQIPIGVQVDENFDEAGYKYIYISGVYLRHSNQTLQVASVEGGAQYSIDVPVYQMLIQDTGSQKLVVLNVAINPTLPLSVVEEGGHGTTFSTSNATKKSVEEVTQEFEKLEDQAGKPVQHRLRTALISEQGIKDTIARAGGSMTDSQKQMLSLLNSLRKNNETLVTSVSSGNVGSLQRIPLIGPVFVIDVNAQGSIRKPILPNLGMSQAQLKTIADNSVRMLQSHPERGPLPLSARVDSAKLPGFANYFVSGIVLEGTRIIDTTAPGLPGVDPEGSSYSFKAALVPILLQNSSGQFIVTHVLIPENFIVNYKMVENHIDSSSEQGSTKAFVDDVLAMLAPNVQYRFDIPTKVDQAIIDKSAGRQDDPTTPFDDVEGGKTRVSLVNSFGSRTEHFFADFEAGNLEEAAKIPWIGPPITVQINTP